MVCGNMDNCICCIVQCGGQPFGVFGRYKIGNCPVMRAFISNSFLMDKKERSVGKIRFDPGHIVNLLNGRDFVPTLLQFAMQLRLVFFL